MQGVAVNIPSNIGAGGNVSFDSMPFVKYALETQARNRAKDEAFVKSFQNMAASITPAGMATNDIPSFMQKKQDWINFITKNKDAYENPTNDNGNVYGQAMTKYNDILNHAETSKNKLKSVAPLNSLFQNPDRSNLLTEDFMQKYHNSLLPVDDQNYQPFDISSVDFNPKPFDQTMQNKFYQGIDKNVKRDKVYGQPTIDASTHSKITPYAEVISKESLPLIRNYAATLSGTSASAANFFDSELNNPTDYARLNEIYKQAFPKEGDIGSREDMAAAWTISQLQLKREGQEKSTYTPPRPKAAGRGTASSTANTYNVVDAIADAAQNGDNSALQVAAGNLFKGNGKEKFLGATIDGNGNLVVRTQHTIKNKPIEKAETYSIYDNTLRDKLAGKVQDVMGANAKVENKTYSNSTPAPKAAAKKTISRKDIATKAANAGYTAKEYEQMLIKNGIKITD